MIAALVALAAAAPLPVLPGGSRPRAEETRLEDAATAAGSGDLAAAWLRDGRVETRAASRDALLDRAPLGSVWKLFIYAYSVETGGEPPPYRCAATPRPGEEYCCAPGQTIERDAALARSCALYFEPQRLAIDPLAWRRFWVARTDGAASWLADLARLRPDTSVPIADLLHALAAVPTSARVSAYRALLPVLMDGYGQGALGSLGGALRVKTFTWPHPRRAGASIGGGAGWLVDGTPVWFSARGSSRTVLGRDAGQLAAWLPPPARAPEDEPCVDVDFFERYPIRAVDALPSRAPAEPGPLRGRYRVVFESGTALVFQAQGEMRLERALDRPRLKGRFGLDEYVARVLDREADPRVAEAARALGVVARSWLLRNGGFESGCYRVADSTRAQRVSPSPASAAARRAALFTDGIVLRGQDVRYRLDGAAPGILAWSDALREAHAGRSYDEILSSAFPRATLAALTGEEECRHIPEVEAWLARATGRWRRALAGEGGFEPPEQPLTVCGVGHGNPYVDRARLRIYVRGVRSRDDRVTLAHEYVHLGFQFHPHGGDEAFVERIARTLEE